MIDISRHRELIDTEQVKTPIHVIGVGATGSYVAYALAKLGLTDITVYDFDKVEEHNIANQLFGIADVGAYKVDALQAIILRDTGITIKTSKERVTNQMFVGFVFVMVDSMASRKEIYLNCIKLKPMVVHAVEPRMGLDMCRIYNIRPLSVKHHKRYEDTLYSDDVVSELSACGNSMTVITSSLMVAGYCVRQFINQQTGVELDSEILFDYKFNNLIVN
jgi:sulfur carrier protein ThiS adenylyltransferase